MISLPWLNRKNVEQEKKDLKLELTQQMMRVERRRGEVETVARDVMNLMHRRSIKNEET